jgi:hypothetical protein
MQLFFTADLFRRSSNFIAFLVAESMLIGQMAESLKGV